MKTNTIDVKVIPNRNMNDLSIKTYKLIPKSIVITVIAGHIPDTKANVFLSFVVNCSLHEGHTILLFL